MGTYDLSVVTPGDEGLKIYEQSAELAKNASEGERRFIETAALLRRNPPEIKKAIEAFETLAKDYERRDRVPRACDLECELLVQLEELTASA